MAAVVASSQTLRPLPILFFLLAIATNDAASFTITNSCNVTIWPAITPGGGGQRLDPGQTWTLDVTSGASSRLWGRTGCYFNTDGQGKCLTGDCGGELSCTSTGQPPITLAEFALGYNRMDFFDISIANGLPGIVRVWKGATLPGQHNISMPRCIHKSPLMAKHSLALGAPTTRWCSVPQVMHL
jgi:hypothetical protein